MKWKTLFTTYVLSTYSVFKYLEHVNSINNKRFNELPEEKQLELKIRDYALKENSFYNSEDALLRRMAIASYEQDKELQQKARFLYLYNQKSLKAQRNISNDENEEKNTCKTKLK